MRPAGIALVLVGLAAAWVAPALAQLEPYETSECFAFWKLKEKLDRDGVGAIVDAGPKGPDGGLPKAVMERVSLYLDLEEKLLFRCPDFAPPPDQAPGKRQAIEPPTVTAKPQETAPAGKKKPAPTPPPPGQSSTVPLPPSRPAGR